MESFGRYQLVKKLASGGMAEIYLARQQGLEGFEKLLVIKRILPHLAEDEEFIQMFLDEARIAARLNHPNIVQIFDLGAIGDHYFIAMEYIHGDDVRRVWKQSDAAGTALPIAHACRIVMDAASALDYAHKRTDPATGKPLGIIHRDISPQNILVSFEGGVKIVDFGIAKAADSSNQTKSGVLKGKYSYMSPEQASGRKIDHRTDIFALGVVLYELLTGIRLFKRATEIETIKAVTECRVEPPSVLNPRVPTDLEPVVMKALVANPDQRYQEAAQLQLAIEEWLVQNRLPSSSAHLKAYMQEIYRDRLAEEARIGRPLWEEMSDSRSELELDRPPRTGITKDTAKSRKRTSQMRSGPMRREELPEIDAEPTEGQASLMSESRPTDSATDRQSEQRRWLPLVVAGAVTLVLGAVVAGVVARQVVAPASEGRTAGVPPRMGVVTVSSNPTGARILLDARMRDETTPATLAEVSFGQHVIVLQKDGYEDRELPFTLDSDMKHLQGDLSPDKNALQAVLKITSSPPGAELIVDGRAEGRTPLTLTRVAGRTAQIELELASYFPLKRSVDLKPGEQELSYVLEPRAVPASSGGAGERTAGERTALVEITSEPRATILINGKERGSTPFRERLAPGRYAFQVVNRDIGLEQTVPVVVRAGHDVHEHLAPRVVPVRIVADPWADVYLSGRKLGQTPMGKVPLAEGEHTFVFKNDELKVTKSVKYVVKAGATAVVKVNMTE